MLLSDTLYCPTIGINLISVSQLFPKCGVNITFYQEYAKIHTPSRAFIAAQYGRLYLLNIWSASKPLGLRVYPSYDMQDYRMLLWHEQIGHQRKKNLQRLVTISTGMEGWPDFYLCESYIYGKIKKSPYKTLFKKGEYLMEYINTNIAGLLPATGYNGSHYWVTSFNNYI